MPRKTFVHNPNIAYHLSARCINHEWFLDLDTTWKVMEDYLYLANKIFSFKIHAFVLMSNHYHLIARFPKNNISHSMEYFMRETSKQITRLSSRVNQTWGSRYFRSGLTSQHYYLLCYKYIYRNPIKAGICSKVEEYKYSTLNGLIGQSSLIIPMVEDTTLFEDVNGTIKWLNQEPSEENNLAVKMALSKPEFKLSKNRSTRKPHELEFDLL